MAHEQAKSPPAAGAPGAKDKGPGDADGLTQEAKSEESRLFRTPARSTSSSPTPSSSPKKKTSLTERLQAEQSKPFDVKDEEDAKPLDLTDVVGSPPTGLQAGKPITRSRRAAGPPPRRIATAANDDLPSIGGLIFALQQRPSRTPFLVALVASAAWFIVGGFFAFSFISAQVGPGGTQDVAANPSALAAAVAILVPIAIFWFLALLVWRAQELRLMASAMTEVAVRLAEPDKLAEQSVASLGQTIRRQVAAMNDAISRAIGRAGELEALVHNEVAALERSYNENELRVRGLISELASEREALSNNSERVSETLKGVGAQVARDISSASGAIDKKLAERGLQLTELLVARSSEAADQVQKAQAKVTEHVPALLDRLSQEQTRLTQVIEGAAKNLSALENVVGERTISLDETLKERTEALTSSLAIRIKSLETSMGQGVLLLDKTLKERTETFAATVEQSASSLGKTLKERTDIFASTINQNAVALDKSLAERTESFATSMASRAKTLETSIVQYAQIVDKALADRGQAVTASLAERLKAIDDTFGHHATAVDKMLTGHAQSVEGSFAQQTAQLGQVLANNSSLMRQTADQVGAQSKEAVGILTNQTQALREVSRGLLDQIHSLTQRFENQGQAILTAAKALDSSNTKINSILESRHQSIIGLLHAVNSKAQDLDGMMRSYSGMIEGAMVQAETRAKQVGAALARDTAGQAQQALAQIERLREEAQAHTARAVGDLKGSFETVITQIGRQLEQMRGQFDHTSSGMREAARQTATDLDSLRQEMQRRMEALPQQTAQATAAIRKALTDQLKEIEAMTPVLNRASSGYQGDGAEPYRQAALPPRSALPPQEEFRPSGQYNLPPLPRFNSQGRQVSASAQGAGDLNSVTNNLAQQLSGATQFDRRGGDGNGMHMQASGQLGGGNRGRRDQWSLGDLLARASTEEQPAFAAPAPGQEPSFANRGHGGAPNGTGQGLRLDEIARAIDHRTAAEVWQRFRSGERGVLGRHLYTQEGQVTFDEIARRYDRDADFRVTVDRYLKDFERLLGEAERADGDGRMLQNYLTSETGRVYLMLAHASGHIR